MEESKVIKIKQQIKKNKSFINKRLIELKVPYKTITIDEGFTKLNISNETGELFNLVIKSLYGYSFDAIKTSFFLKGNHKLTDLLPDDQLIVCDVALDSLRDYLFKVTDFDKKETEKFIKKTGYELRTKYKNDTGISLLEGLNKKNSNETFKNDVLKELSFSKEADEEEVYYGTRYYKEQLETVLPSKFDNIRYYGNTIGTFNLTFYNMKVSEIFKFIRSQGVKFTATKIEDVAPLRMKQYIYTAVEMLDRMVEDFSSTDTSAFEIKTVLLGMILKEDYVKTYGKEPLIDLVEHLKKEKGVETETKKPRVRKNYALERKKNSGKANTLEQIIRTDKNE